MNNLTQRQRWFVSVMFSVLVVGGSFILLVTTPSRFNPFVSHCGPANPRVACLANLRHLNEAKIIWGLENKRTGESVPRDADLFGPALYLREKPVCPSGGAYLLGRVSRKPRCTVPGHTI